MTAVYVTELRTHYEGNQVLGVFSTYEGAQSVTGYDDGRRRVWPPEDPNPYPVDQREYEIPCNSYSDFIITRWEVA